MESTKKRKRIPVIKIEQDSDVEIVSDKDDDDDYEPVKKKAASVRAPKVSKPPIIINPKIKKELKGKIKAVKKKIASVVKGENNSFTENVIQPTDFFNTEKGPILNNEDEVLPYIDEKPSARTMSDADIEKLVSKSISEAKKSYHPWKDEEVVADNSDIPVAIAKNVINLLNQDCTIPFIVRYRKEMTGGLQAEKLREIQESYDEVKQVHKKVENILKTIKNEKFDVKLATSFLDAKSLDEVELLYAPYKPGSKKSFAERSKQLGLEPIALQLFEAKIPLNQINIKALIKPQKGLTNEKEIMTGLQHIIADKISKDRKVLDLIKEIDHHHQIRILSSKSASAEKEDRAAFVEGKSTQNFKYENYFQLDCPVKYVASHQIMALNRGEKQKVLKVKIQIPTPIEKKITGFIWSTFFAGKYYDKQTFDFLKSCTDDAYERLIEPYISRRIRSQLTKKAEKESISVFGSNVRSLLLTPPVRGKTVLGIDPGFSHGCKLAVVSSKGDVLGTDVVYPHTKGKQNSFPDVNAENILHLISTFRVEVIAIGNGTACRETEVWLSQLINSRFFYPFQVKYCIVNENGASIYSVTKEAEAELPGLDPNIRSAISIARRLQDPLLEYVKIEPKHLGVGMYQHDVPESQMKKALDSIVEECVSFVGVDLNVCPETLLRKIAGLSAAKAKQIVEWRTKNGCFINRQQLLSIKGLGQKSFEQCAGFVKVLRETCTVSPEASAITQHSNSKSSKSKKDVIQKFNPLDSTIIHPESYSTAEKFLQELNIDPSSIGQQVLVGKVNDYMKFQSVEALSSKFCVPVAGMQLIIDAFRQLQDYDIRAEFDQPLFQTSVRTFSDLQKNQELTGRVANVTGFGAFVDIGVGTDGLIHISKMKGRKLCVGDRVTVKVLETNAQKKRIGLELKL